MWKNLASCSLIGFSGAQFVGSTAAAPFEFNPIFGLLILGIWGAVTKFKNKK